MAHGEAPERPSTVRSGSAPKRPSGAAPRGDAPKRPAQPERDYSHRDVVDKLGIKPGFAVAFDAAPLEIDPDLRQRALDRTGRPAAASDEPVDVILVGVDASTDVVSVLSRWRARIDQAGGIWLLTPKRGNPGYIDQRDLILSGPDAGVVDNKSCSVSDTLSGLRFVIRKSERVPPAA